MSKCKHCCIEVLDQTDTCPLCRSILNPVSTIESAYPNVQVKMRKLTLISNIYLFFIICVEAILISINWALNPHFWWSIISGVALLYSYLVLRYAIQGQSGYRSKILILTVFAILSSIAVDMLIGYHGWSVDYVLPAGILLVDLIILICMIVNRRNWQSYLIWQLFMILCSLIPVTLYYTGLERNPLIVFLPMALSVAIFLGTLIIGDRKARRELYRRFHI